TSGRWHRPTVDNVFGPCDGRRTWRRQKRDQISYLFRLGRPAERNAAKRIHDELSTTLVVGGVLPRDLRDETHSAGSLDPARRDTDDAHPLGTHFLGQRLAVVRQGRFRRRVGDRRLGQRHPILYRGDVAIGLPGKSPVSFVRTTVLPSRATTATGSTVCRYFFLVSSLQALIAFRPCLVWPSSLTVACAAKRQRALRGHECSRMP